MESPSADPAVCGIQREADLVWFDLKIDPINSPLPEHLTNTKQEMWIGELPMSVCCSYAIYTYLLLPFNSIDTYVIKKVLD